MALKTEKYRKYYLKCSNTFFADCTINSRKYQAFKKNARVLLWNNRELMQSFCKKYRILEISLTQILYFDRWLPEKAKILLVCSKIIANLHSQSEKKKMHIFKSINEKFVDFINLKYNNEILYFINELPK